MSQGNPAVPLDPTTLDGVSEVLTPARAQVPELEGELVIPGYPEVTAGYAEIYRGIWRSPGGEEVEVAVKELRILIPKTRQTTREALESRTNTRLRREVLVWSKAKHPNIHPFLGYRLQPRPRLISPWCKHGNLADYLDENPNLLRLDKLRMVHQVASGLNYLHSQDPPICHADIKPENALINDRFEVALSDFGLSRILQDLDCSSGLTTSEGPKGTHNYMAMELFTEEKPRSGRKTDVYAFGGLILRVMSGKPPFWRENSSRIFARLMQNQFPKPEEHPNMPSNDSLWYLIHRCWNSNPTARPSMQEILEEVQYELSYGSGAQSRRGRIKVIDESSTNFGYIGDGDVHTSSCIGAGASLSDALVVSYTPGGKLCKIKIERQGGENQFLGLQWRSPSPSTYIGNANYAALTVINHEGSHLSSSMDESWMGPSSTAVWTVAPDSTVWPHLVSDYSCTPLRSFKAFSTGALPYTPPQDKPKIRGTSETGRPDGLLIIGVKTVLIIGRLDPGYVSSEKVPGCGTRVIAVR